MPVQYLYPTGIKVNWNSWVNQSGHLYTSPGIGVKDIDEGVPGSSGDWLQSSTAFSTYFYRLDLLCGPLLVEPEYVTFRSVYFYSGEPVDAPADYIEAEYVLRDRSGRDIAFKSTNYTLPSLTNWNTITESGYCYNRDNFDLTDTSLLYTLVGRINFGGGYTSVSTTNHLLSSIEIIVSGDNVRTSGCPLYMAGYPHKNVCLKPQAFDGLSNRWLTNYNYSGAFNLGYFRLEEGSGNVIRADNTSLSGVYHVTYDGLYQSGMLWHNKRLSLNQSPTYEHAPKFNSINDSAILFNSGILYNRDTFTILSRFFPSGSVFTTNNPGYVDLICNAPQSGTADYGWKIQTSGYTTFNAIMWNSTKSAATTASFDLDATMGVDLIFSYNSGTMLFYGQNHLGVIASGVNSASSIYQDHRYKLSIGGLLASGI
jgi:hypothetical protein